MESMRTRQALPQQSRAMNPAATTVTTNVATSARGNHRDALSMAIYNLGGEQQRQTQQKLRTMNGNGGDHHEDGSTQQTHHPPTVDDASNNNITRSGAIRKSPIRTAQNNARPMTSMSPPISPMAAASSPHQPGLALTSHDSSSHSSLGSSSSSASSSSSSSSVSSDASSMLSSITPVSIPSQNTPNHADGSAPPQHASEVGNHVKTPSLRGAKLSSAARSIVMNLKTSQMPVFPPSAAMVIAPSESDAHVAALPQIPTTTTATAATQTIAKTKLPANARTESTETAPMQPQCSRVGLIGRTKPMKMIQNAIDTIFKGMEEVKYQRQQQTMNDSTETKPPSPILVHSNQFQMNTRMLLVLRGGIGVGKSSLIQHFRQQIVFERYGIFVTAASTISDMLTQICRQLLLVPFNKYDPRNFAYIQRLLKEKLTTSQHALLSAEITEFQTILDRKDKTQHTQQQPKSERKLLPLKKKTSLQKDSVGTSDDANAASLPSQNAAAGAAHSANDQLLHHGNRYRLAVQQLIRVICNHVCPIVVAVDGENDSMDQDCIFSILKYWLNDTTISNLLVLGCERTDDLSHPSKIVSQHDFRSSKMERFLRLQEIHLAPFDNTMYVHAYVMASLYPIHNGLGFAKALQDRTKGVVYAMKRCIRELMDDRLLWYDVTIKKWMWNEQGLLLKNERSSAATTPSMALPTAVALEYAKKHVHSVVDAMRILPIAACLGGAFSADSIHTIIDAFQHNRCHPDDAPFYNSIIQQSSASDTITKSDISKILHDCEVADLLCIDSNGGHQRSANVHKNSNGDGSMELAKYSANSQKERQASLSLSPGAKMYRFADGSILQQAALALISSTEKVVEWKHRIGQVLLMESRRNEAWRARKSYVLDLLNPRMDLLPSLNSTGTARRLQVVMLHYEVGIESAQRSLFRQALECFENAIGMLPNQANLKLDIDGIVDLYASAAECAKICARYDLVERYCEILLNLSCPTLHKIRAYCILVDAAVADDTQNQNGRSISTTLDPVQLCLSALSQLGCNITQKNTLRQRILIRQEKHKLRRTAHAWGTRFVDQLRSVANSKRESAIIILLDKLITVSRRYDPDLTPFAISKSVKLTLESGIASFSPPAFAMQGLLLTRSSTDLQLAKKFGQGALYMFHRLGRQNEAESRTINLVHNSLMHWVFPLEGTKQAFVNGYNIGLQQGNMESALGNILSYIRVCFFTGKKLDTIDKDMALYSSLMKDFGQAVHLRHLSMTWQAVLNLKGASNYSTQLVGDSFDERSMNSPNSSTLQRDRLELAWNQAYVAMIFGAYKLGADISVQTIDDRHGEGFDGSITVLVSTFCASFCCFATASDVTITQDQRKTKDSKKYVQIAQKYRKQLKTWQEKGCPNCRHFIAILDAENELLRYDTKRAMGYYQKAASMARKRHYTQDQALIYERLTACLAERTTDATQAKVAFQECRRHYAEWGATAKLAQLEQRWSNLL